MQVYTHLLRDGICLSPASLLPNSYTKLIMISYFPSTLVFRSDNMVSPACLLHDPSPPLANHKSYRNETIYNCY